MQIILFSPNYLYPAQSSSTQSEVEELIPTVHLSTMGLERKKLFIFHQMFMLFNHISIFNFEYVFQGLKKFF